MNTEMKVCETKVINRTLLHRIRGRWRKLTSCVLLNLAVKPRMDCHNTLL